jgi:hypothetical protein
VRDDTPDDGDAAIADGAVDVVDVPLFFVEQPGDRRIRICLAESSTSRGANPAAARHSLTVIMVLERYSATARSILPALEASFFGMLGMSLKNSDSKCSEGTACSVSLTLHAMIAFWDIVRVVRVRTIDEVR